MKCIKNCQTGKIIRISNDAALNHVIAGTHVFVPKIEWKKQTQPTN